MGVGGMGLSAIARVLLGRGYAISGSDARRTALTDELAAMGMTIFVGHEPQHVQGADLVIVSSAVPADNVELVAAREAGIAVVKRARILGEMMQDRIGIAVAGTHGKTTTTALIAFVLTELGLEPTYIVGGILQNLGSNAHEGSGRHFVIEADEYDRTFLGLRPRLAVVTAIDMDHPDCFRDIEDMTEAYEQFLHLLPRGGTVVGCLDHPRVQEVMRRAVQDRGLQVITYGLAAGAEWTATGIVTNSWGGSDFQVLRRSETVGQCRLHLPGRHNVSNALAVLAVADVLGLERAAVLETTSRFRGVRRRFELKGEEAGITVVDDYAHHPTEIRATLAAARQRYGPRPLWVFFQPHTYSRTKALLGEFAESFADADHVIISEIYGAREHDDLGMHAQDLVRIMVHPDVHVVDTLGQASEQLAAALQRGDVLLTLGAGDGYLVGEAVLAALSRRVGAEGYCEDDPVCCSPVLREVTTGEP